MKQKERIDDLMVGNLKIIQNKEYFCFGTDSVLLANFVHHSARKKVVIDLCSGGGVIPILLSAKIQYERIIGVEIQPEMFALFKRNIALNKLEDAIVALQGDVTKTGELQQFLEQTIGRKTVDMITVNPPYKPIGKGVVNTDNVKYLARHEALCDLESIFKTSASLLQSGGKLAMVHKPERLADLITLARKYHLEVKRIRYVYPKIEMKPSIILLEYVKDGGSEVLMLPPLIEYNEQGEYTEELKKIYLGEEKKNE